jgi:outer membrane protein OmpA-like peptidoglycan-associated protein
MALVGRPRKTYNFRATLVAYAGAGVVIGLLIHFIVLSSPKFDWIFPSAAAPVAAAPAAPAAPVASAPKPAVAKAAPKPAVASKPTTQIAKMEKALAAGALTLSGVHFATASARILPESEGIIANVGKVLAAEPKVRVTIQGHTDNTGDAAANQRLSKERADAVKADLASHYHVAANRMATVGYGQTRPVASNATEAGRAQNRRVTLVPQK